MSDLFRDRLGREVFFALVHDSQFLSSKLKPCFFTDLGTSGLRALSPNNGEAMKSRTSQKKTVHEIPQSASQLKILDQKQPALSERNARRRAVIGHGERVRAAVWGSR